MVKIRSKSPLRISFGGGGTDVSPYTEDYGGVALNVTINKYSYGYLELKSDKLVTLKSYNYNKELSFDLNEVINYGTNLDLLLSVFKNTYTGNTGLNLELYSEAEPRSGLGGSAAAFCSLIGLFNHLKNQRKLNSYEISELAYKLEREELKILGGRQDQYASVFGGLNFIEFKGHDFVRVSPLRIKKDYILELESNLILAKVNQRNDTERILEDQKKNILSGKSIESMHRTKELAYDMRDALYNGNLDFFGKLLDDAWEEKKKFTNLMSNEHINNLYNVAKINGALGGKITGAGGGGHILFYCKTYKKELVQRALIKEGATIVDFSFDFDGLQVWDVD